MWPWLSSEKEAIMTSQLSRTAAPAKHPKAGSNQLGRSVQAHDETAGAAMPRAKRLESPVRRLLRMMDAVIVRPLRAAGFRRELAQLSDRQLRDAGIDPALAGRGKAAAVDKASVLRLLSLSFD
jgi:uncharacterized protein YjiS (DUF1127 family)